MMSAALIAIATLEIVLLAGLGVSSRKDAQVRFAFWTALSVAFCLFGMIMMAFMAIAVSTDHAAWWTGAGFTAGNIGLTLLFLRASAKHQQQLEEELSRERPYHLFD